MSLGTLPFNQKKLVFYFYEESIKKLIIITSYLLSSSYSLQCNENTIRFLVDSSNNNNNRHHPWEDNNGNFKLNFMHKKLNYIEAYSSNPCK